MGNQGIAAYHKHGKQKHNELGLEKHRKLEKHSLANKDIQQHTHLYLVVIPVAQIMYCTHNRKQIHQRPSSNNG